MKKIISILIFTLILTSISFAEIITRTYYFNEPVLTPDSIYTRIEITEGVVVGTPGYPALPYRGISLLIPQNENITNVLIEKGNEIDLGEHIVYPIQRSVPISDTSGYEFTEPDPEIYGSSEPFPAKQNTDFSTHYLAGYSIGFLSITPFTYIPITGELSYFEEITVIVETEYSDVAATAADKFLCENPEIEKRLKILVENYDDKDAFYNITKERPDSAYDYIIVTSEEYADDFQPLADFHSRQGYRTKIELIESILTNYTGVDDQDKLRNYFIEQYEEEQNYMQYVLLGGDSAPDDPSNNIIQHRGLYVNYYCYIDYDIPADMYYACLDRTSAPGDGPDWNNDNDDMWGEPDEADLLAEFYIGRICVNNSTDISNFINKTILYSETPVVDGINSALLVGELLWGPPQYPTYTYGGTYMNELIGGCSNNGYTTVGIPADWDISTLYEMNGYWTSSDLYTQLNLGPNLLCHLGHGNPTHCLNIDNSDLTTYHITNDGITHNFINGYSQACYSGSMDNWHFDGYYGPDCFAEKISTMSTATSTFIANSRYGWGEAGGTDGASQIFNREWIDTFFDDGVYSIGGTNQVSKEHAIPFIEAQQVVRWCCYELNVFGDPSLELWTEEPTNLSATYPQTIMAGIPEIGVIAPAFSRITVYDDDTIFGYGMTNFLGEGTVVFDNIPQEAGIMHISIVAHNYYKYVGDITVTACVVNVFPDTIYANVPSTVTITVLSPDSITPEVGVNVWAEGLDYISDTVVTNDDGIANLTVNYPFGPIVQIYGQRPENDYYTFHEELHVIADDLTNPDLTVTTNFGLEDTFALNLPGTIYAYVENDETTLWISIDDSLLFSTSGSSYEVTPLTMNPVISIISKSGYNLYQEEFPVIIAYGSVSGIVTNSETGNPVPDIEIKFYEQGANPTTDDPLFTDVTNTDGLYEITEDQPVDYYDIYIDEWGYNSYEEPDYFLGYGSNSHDIVIEPVESAAVHGRIYDENGAVGNTTITYYRSDNGEQYTEVNVGISGRYSVTLPYFTYDVYVSAPEHVPFRGSITIDYNATVDYSLGLAALFCNFEDNDGDFSPTPPTNAWEWGEPTAGDINAYSGLNVWATNLDGHYVDNANWYLESPEFTAPDSAILIFYHYYDFEQASSGTLYDGGNVKISTNGGASFNLITPIDGYDGNVIALGEQGFGETNYDWEPVEFDISNYAGNNIILKWHFASDQGVCDHYGWYIDDVLVGDPNSSEQIIHPHVSVDNTQLIYKLELSQNYPNPVNPDIIGTNISFSLPKNTKEAEIRIYNIKGQLIKKFKMQNAKCGMNSVVWNGKDENSKSLSSGIYFYSLKVGNKVIDTKKCLLIR